MCDFFNERCRPIIVININWSSTWRPPQHATHVVMRTSKLSTWNMHFYLVSVVHSETPEKSIEIKKRLTVDGSIRNGY
jgi:hypothetical protein